MLFRLRDRLGPVGTSLMAGVIFFVLLVLIASLGEWAMTGQMPQLTFSRIFISLAVTVSWTLFVYFRFAKRAPRAAGPPAGPAARRTETARAKAQPKTTPRRSRSQRRR